MKLSKENKALLVLRLDSSHRKNNTILKCFQDSFEHPFLISHFSGANFTTQLILSETSSKKGRSYHRTNVNKIGQREKLQQKTISQTDLSIVKDSLYSNTQYFQTKITAAYVFVYALHLLFGFLEILKVDLIQSWMHEIISVGLELN